MREVFPAVSVALNKTLKAAVLAVSPLLLGQIALTIAPQQSFFTSSLAQAQVRASNKHKDEQRKFPNVTESFGKKIQEAAAFLQPPEETKAKPDPRKAMEVLAGLEANKAKYNAYEMVLLYQYYGYSHLAQENYGKAIEYFNRVLGQTPNLPVATEAQTMYTMGQLYSAEDNPKKALETLLRWTQYIDELTPDQSYLFASLYYQLEDNRNALANINEAVKNQEASGKVPSESWYILQRGLYFDKEDYKNGLIPLEKLIKHYPKAIYWKNISQVYRVMNRDKDSLHALEVCYLMGGITTEKDVLNLSYLYLDAETPFKAAKVLKKGLYKDKVIEPTAKNLKLLADSLRLAQDAKESLSEYEKAAEKSQDGELIIGLAGAYLANDKFKDASKWGRTALKKGKLKRVDQANFIVAQSEFELKNFEEAIKFFKEAGKDSRSTKTANQWIEFAKREKIKYELSKNE
jgi:tetratricopeptide (TPR) repeat protein